MDDRMGQVCVRGAWARDPWFDSRAGGEAEIQIKYRACPRRLPPTLSCAAPCPHVRAAS
jgi:hypothetical protein